MKAMRVCVVIGLLGALALSAGCRSSKEVPSSGARPPTEPERVKIYQKPQGRYEVLGTVTASSTEGARWDDRAYATEGFNTLRKKAAALGANGVLLMADEGQYEVNATAGFEGKYYQVPVRGKAGEAIAVAKAIYVIDD